LASTRSLWIVLRARDEASRVMHGFSRNVRDASRAARAAHLSALAGQERQRAEMHKTNSVLAQQIRTANDHINVLDRQAKRNALAATMARQYRDEVLRTTGATNNQIAAANKQIQSLDRQASMLSRTAALERTRTQRMRADLDSQVRSINRVAEGYEKEARALRVADAAAREREQTLRRLAGITHQVSAAFAGLGIAFAAVGVAGGVAMGDFIQTAIEYERQVRLTRTQVDKMSVSFETLHGIGTRVAKEIAVRFEEVQPALFDIFSSIEVGAKDAEMLLRAFAKGAVAGQTEIASVSRATIGIMNSFKLPLTDVNKILDLQFELVQEGVGTYEEWVQRIGLVSPSAHRAGQSVEMMVAALATFTRMGMSAARSGTSVARAFDAMSHPKAIKKMEQLGIKVRDAQGHMLPLNQTLRQFRDILMKMPEKDRVATILEVFKGAGSTIEARRFIQTILLSKGALETFDMILKETENSAGNMERAYSEMASTTAAKTQMVRDNWIVIKEALGRELMPTFNRMLDAILGVLKGFDRLSPGAKKMIAQFLIWGTVISGVLAAIFLLVAGIGVFVAVVGTALVPILAVAAGLGLIVLGLGGAAAAFILAMKKSEPFKQFIENLGQDIKWLYYGVIEPTARKIAEAWNTHMLPPLRKLVETVETRVLPAVDTFRAKLVNQLLPAAKEVGNFLAKELKNAFEKIGEIIETKLIPAIEDLTKWYQENREEIHLLIGFVITLTKWLSKLAILFGIAGVVGGVLQAVAGFQIFILMCKSVFGSIMFVITAIKALISWVRSAWRDIVGMATGSIQAILRLAGVINGWKNSAIAAITSVIVRFFQLKTSILSVFVGAGSWLYNAGRAIISGLASGIRGAIGSAVSAAASAAGAALEAAKRRIGVRSPSKAFMMLGRDSMRGFAIGIRNTSALARDAVVDALDRATGQASASRFGGLPQSSRSPAAVGVGNGTGGTSTEINQSFVINTQEINPRMHAQILGFELASRM
jgi:TP901 family phage tail tape measure protein